MMDIASVMALAPVIPVLVIEDPADARPIAEALVAGGLRALEVTLRTPAALEVIAEMARVEGAVVGAGTVLTAAQLDAATAAGARFFVAPGLTDRLGVAAIERGLAFLPGIASAAELMRGLEMGLAHFKFFPAVANGGIPALKALTGPFGDARFCPTGGITAATAAEWLALPGVVCVGGTWLVPAGPVDRAAITARAATAVALALAAAAAPAAG